MPSPETGIIPEVSGVSVPEANIQVFFTPEHKVHKHIEWVVHTAPEPMAIEIYAFTSMKLAQLLVAAQNRGKPVRVLMDSGHYHAWEAQRRIYTFLKAQGVPVLLDVEASLLHVKTLIVKNTRVVTGSPNYTKMARTQVENLLDIKSPELANIYWHHFDRRWNRNSRAQRAARYP